MNDSRRYFSMSLNEKTAKGAWKRSGGVIDAIVRWEEEMTANARMVTN